MMKTSLAFALALLYTSVNIASGGNILFVYPNCSPSHKNVAVPTMLGLADRGHNVTVISSFKTESHKNLRDIIPFTNFDYIPNTYALEMRRQGLLGALSFDNSHLFDFCDKVYENEEVKELFTKKFDLILMDTFTNECMLGLIHKLGSPFILVSPLPVAHHVAAYVGNRLPLSFVPHFLIHMGHRMTFLERALNMLANEIGTWAFVNKAFPYHEAVYKKHLGNDLPGVYEILKNVSMILVNSHFDFNFPRPTLPDVVEVGAAHCKPGRPLPKDLHDFLTGAEHGFILFSLGSIVRPHEMPEESRKVFVNVFSRLKQRVLWKWPNDMPDLPPNVKLSKWIPQQDVLAHPNIRLFITHGGLLSTQESIYHSVPMVVIPVFGDQDLNANRATQAGIAVTVEILSITEEALENGINQVLNDKSFAGNVKEMSKRLKDQPETPKQRAIFWAEYVMRHKGAPNLRSAARDLNFFQYYCLDVAAVLLSLATAVQFAVFLLVRKTLYLFLGLFTSQKANSKVKRS